MRKLQTTGKTGSRTGTALCRIGKAQPGARSSRKRTHVSAELKFQQQPQAAIFRPSAIKYRAISLSRQKQRPKASAGCGAENASTRESHSFHYTSAGNLLPLWLRYKQSCTHRRSCQSAIGSSRRSPTDSPRISSPCCNLPSLSVQHYCHHPIRVFFGSGRFKTGGFHKHSEAKISYECAPDTGVADHTFWLKSENVRRNYRKCRSRHFLCRSSCLSGSARSDTEVTFNLVRRDRLVSSRDSAMVMGSHFRRSESVSHFVKSQQQSIETYTWQLFWLSYVRPMGKLFDLPSSKTPALPEPFDSRFSKSSRPGSRGQETGCLGRQRIEKGDEVLESLPPWADFEKAAESVCQANTQPIQDSGEMRSSVERPFYGRALQKPQKEVGCDLGFRKISGKSRTNKQSSGKSLAKACNLAKNFTGQQIAERADFRSEINDYYSFACPAGPKHNGFSRNHAQKFSSGVSAAKAELESSCLRQQNQFAHLTVEKTKIFGQSSAYANISSCGSATT